MSRDTLSEDERAVYEKVLKILRHTYPEKSGIYFICGHGGDVDKNGLPDRVFICPTYGADWFEVYERKKDA